MKKLIGVFALLSLVGCGRAIDEQYTEATPDFDGLALEITGAASEGQALTAGQRSDGVDDGSAPEYLRHTRNGVAALNAKVKAFLEPIAALAASEKGTAVSANVRMYGPKDHGGATYRLFIQKQTEARFGWRLDAKTVGAEDATYKPVGAGAITKGELPHRGRGGLGLDFDVLGTIDAAVKARGKLLVGFAHVGDTKTLVYGLKGFSADPATHQPIDAAFVGHRLMPSRATSVRMATYANLAESPSAATKELVRSRVRWIPGVGGRADLLVTEGDVPVGKIYVGSACWDAVEKEGFAILRLCTKGQLGSCEVVGTPRGQPSNCKPGLEKEALPAENAQDTTAEEGAPSEDVVAPPGMPSGSGE
jgi:hypothetical protein